MTDTSPLTGVNESMQTDMEFERNIESSLFELGRSTGNILITGGSGYFGSVLTELLLRRGFKVSVVDNLSYSQNTLFNYMHLENFKFIYGDVTNVDFVKKLLLNYSFDYVIPLASIVGFPVSEQKPELTWLVNYNAVLNVLNNIKDDTKVLFPCTNSGYGLTTGQIECDENTPITPISTYGKSKMAAESAIVNRGNFVSMRFATLFGFSQRMRTDLMVNDFVLKAVRDKSIVLFERKFKRNFLHVRDASRAFLWAMLNWDKMKDNIYNVGHPDYNLNKEELCELIRKQVPDFQTFFAEIGSDPDKRNYIISNRKIISASFKFNYSLETGISELIKGYEAFRDYRFRNY